MELVRTGCSDNLGSVREVNLEKQKACNELNLYKGSYRSELVISPSILISAPLFLERLRPTSYR